MFNMFKKMKLTLNLFLIIIFITGFSNASLSFARDISSMEISADSGESLQIQLLLIDPDEYKTGFDFSTNTDTDQIPNSGHDIENIPGIPPTSTIVVSRPKSGRYHLKIRGTALIVYTLELRIVDSSGNIHTPYFEGITDFGLVTTYFIAYDPTPGFISKAEKIVTISDAKNDVNTAYDLGLITNAGIEQSLIAKLNAAEKAINKGKKQTAENQLNAFINEVNAQKGKHIKDEAIKILLEDAEYLINNL